MKTKQLLEILNLMNAGLWEYNAETGDFLCGENFENVFYFPELLEEIQSKIIETVSLSNYRVDLELPDGIRTYNIVTTSVGKLYSGTITDITDSVEEKSLLTQLAFYDNLTGLGNRVSCIEYLSESTKGFYLFFDIYKFKTINDTFGHLAGDDVLIQFANILKDQISSYGSVFRLSGDEFLAHIEVTKFPIVKNVIKNVIRDLKNAKLPGLINLRTNIGIVKYKIGMDPSTILQKADLAMYIAKHSKEVDYVLADNNVMDKFIDEVEYTIRMNKILNFGDKELDSLVLRRTSDNTMISSLVHSIYKNN